MSKVNITWEEATNSHMICNRPLDKKIVCGTNH